MNEKYGNLTSPNGNIDPEIAHLRDTFLNSEFEYLKHLLSSESIRKLVLDLNNTYYPEKLYQMAMERINAIENGEVEEKNLSRVEGEATILLAAISDKALIKELVLYLENEKENEDSEGLSR